MPGMNTCLSGEDWGSKGKEVLVRPQGAQRPRLGPLPARGAKPHSLRLKNNRHERSAGLAGLGKTHPQERQQSGGVAGRGTECSPETGLKVRPQEFSA